MSEFEIEKREVRIEQNVLRACILSTSFLQKYIHLHRSGLLYMVYGDWIAETCIEYYKNYKEAPKKNIKDLLKAAVKSNTIPDQIKKPLVPFLKETFVKRAKINHFYLLEQIKDSFVLRIHDALKEKLEIATEQGDARLCEQAVSETKQMKMQTAQVVNVFTETEKLKQAFENQRDPLFHINGPVGDLLNDQMKLKKLVAFLGNAKGCKTTLKYHLGKVARRQGNNVALFACGDEEEDDSLIRLAMSVTKRNTDAKYCGKRVCPVMDCKHNQTDECHKKNRVACHTFPELEKDELKGMRPEDLLDMAPKHEPCTYCRDNNNLRDFEASVWYKWTVVNQLTHQHAKKMMEKHRKWHSPDAQLMVWTYESGKLTFAEIDRQLDMFEDMYNFIPTVVIVDYMDIMGVCGSATEFRHQERDRWDAARAFNQRRGCLLITSTQSNRDGLILETKTLQNINEDRRKADFVTAFYGINQTLTEKRQKVARLGVIAQRKGDFDIERQAYMLQCLDKSIPWVDSAWCYRAIQDLHK